MNFPLNEYTDLLVTIQLLNEKKKKAIWRGLFFSSQSTVSYD